MQLLRLRRAFLSLALLGELGLLAAPLDAARGAEDLPRLGVTLPATSVSGLSSGAYMAGQIELAHSKDIVGAGVVAGGPFACAETASGQLFPYWPIVMWQNASQAANACMKVSWGVPDAEKLAKRAKELAEDGKIDDLSGLADDKVYLFSGDEDQTVERPVVEAAKRFYAAAGVPEGSVTLVERQGGHAFITETEGTACGLSEQPYVSDCDYDQAKAILEWIYGAPLADPSPSPTGKFIIFDQSLLRRRRRQRACRRGRRLCAAACETTSGCRLHIALHGCEQARESVGDAFIKESGFARYADTNRLVLLFPQDRGERGQSAWLLGLVGL